MDDLPESNEVYQNPEPFGTLVRTFKGVAADGSWSPTDCRPTTCVAVIVPIRNRWNHLLVFLRSIHVHLQLQKLNYRIFVVNQTDSLLFNRGMLMNIGFVEASKMGNFSCFIFHDVDKIPLSSRSSYACWGSPVHLSSLISSLQFRLPYETFFGGVVMLNADHYSHSNGFPNRYWGWGGEDDDFSLRLTAKGYKIIRPDPTQGRYESLQHLKEKEGKDRMENLHNWREFVNSDGLNNLKYKLLEVVFKDLYTEINVNLE